MKKINKFSKTYMKQILINVISSIIFAAAISAVSFNSMETFIKYQISNSLYSVSVPLYSIYTEYGINEDSIDYLNALMTGYKENLNIDISIYINNEELLSTSDINTDYTDKEFIKALKENGVSINGDADINGNGYYNCTIALYDENEKYIGAILVGKEVDLIATSLRGRQMIYVAFIWVICIMYILFIGKHGIKRYNKYLELTKELNTRGD